MPDTRDTERLSLELDLDGDLSALDLALRDLQGLADQFGQTMTGAFKQSITEGKRFEDVLRTLALKLSDKALNAALGPLQAGIGTLFSGFSSQLSSGLSSIAGGLFGGGGVQPFANGGIVSSPTLFPMGGGAGLMGEAGPEAIMPLARGSDGRLGVRTGAGSRPVNITFNVTARDAGSFRRSEADITSMIARAAHRGRRGL